MISNRRPNQYSLRFLLGGVTILALALGTGTCVYRAFVVPHDDPSIGPIHDVAFCPDGKQFVTGNQDGTVRLWDVQTGNELRSFGKQRPAVTCVAVSSDGRFIAANWNDGPSAQCGTVIWNLATGIEVRKCVGHTGMVNAVAFTRDNRRIISAGSDQTVRVWNLATGREVFCLRGHEAEINAVCVSADGQYVLSAAGDNWGSQLHDPTLRLWSLTDGSQVRIFKGHSGAVYGCAMTPDGKLAASASWDGTIRIWNVATGEQIRCFGDGSDFNTVAIHPNGRWLVSGSGFTDGKVLLWDLTTGEQLRSFDCDTVVRGVDFSPDGMLVASAHGNFAGRPARGFSLTGMESYVHDGVAILWKVENDEKVLQVGDSAGGPVSVP